MFLFTKGTNEQSVPCKITVREHFMNIWKKNNQVSHCRWEVPRKGTVCCQYSRMIKRFLKFNVPFSKRTNEQSVPSEIAVKNSSLTFEK